VDCHCSISAARQPGYPFSGFSTASCFSGEIFPYYALSWLAALGGGEEHSGTFERKRITSGIRVGIVLNLLFNGRLTLLKEFS